MRIVEAVVVTVAAVVMMAMLVPSFSATRVNMWTKIVSGRLVAAVRMAEYRG